MKRKDEEGSHSLPSPIPRKPSSFYKLMLQPSIQSKKLMIPEMFARTYGDEVSTAAILTVPTQKSWKVALMREDNKLWFHDGWQEFVEYFSIGFAYFLQFIYEGNSKFKVHIFNTTACEISYSYNTMNSPQGRKRSGTKHHNTVRFPLKKMGVNYNIGVEGFDVIKSESDVDDNDCNNEELEESAHSTEADGAEQRNHSENLWLKAESLVLAGFTKPENPYFVTFIKKRHVHTTPSVHVPADFGRAYLQIDLRDVRLETPDGRQWPVRCNRTGRFTLTSGWIIFARENNLKSGDICAFELIDAENYILKVHIVRKQKPLAF